MKTQVNCNNCNNPFGTLKEKVLEIDYKRVNNIQHDFKENKSTLKCRKCSHFSILKFKEELTNEIDYKLTAKGLL